MIGRLYAGRTSTLADLTSGLKWAYLESEIAPEGQEEAVDLVALPFEGLEAYGTGRAFGPAGELRWQRDADGFAVQFLAEDGAQVPDGLKATGETFEIDEETGEEIVHLWGLLADRLPAGHARHGDEGVWIEAQIPRAFAYPIEAGEKEPAWVGIRARHYRRGGIVIATRWVEVVEVKG